MSAATKKLYFPYGFITQPTKPGLSGNIENLFMEIQKLIIHKEKKQQQINA